MNAKTLMTTAFAGLLATAAHAITSDEIAAALDVDPSVGTFSTGGDAEWFVDAVEAHQGSTSLRSGVLPETWDFEQESKIVFSVTNDRPIEVAFWVSTSCSYWDGGLSIIVDGAYRWNFTGETDWERCPCVLLPGTHEIVWRYYQYGYSEGEACAWLDCVKVTPLLGSSDKVKVSEIKCVQRTPWNGKVDIDYVVTCENSDADVWVYPVGYDKDSNTTMAPRALEGDGVNAPVKAGTHRMTWTVTDDYPNFNSTAFTVKITALTGAAPYMVVDLSGGVDALSYPVSYLSSVPAGGWGDEYKTTKMVFRLVPAGTFTMGCPSDEIGYKGETLHGVVLTKPFYLGVFECTQKQYQLVTGETPSGSDGDFRPVSNVSYDDIRGAVNGRGWPLHDQVDANSFMGRLRSKANMLFDLPTEAQWEYACRAGTASALNNGKAYSEDALKEVARCALNGDDGKGGYWGRAKVGCYRPNAWGFYDMHGNVWEWCRDCGAGYGSEVVCDPKGEEGSWRTYRGGSYYDEWTCKSAYRNGSYCDGTDGAVGFRVSCSPVAQ